MPLKQWKPVVYTIPSTNVSQTRDFYSKLLGIDINKSATEEFEAYDGRISDVAGIDLALKPRSSDYETPTLYFAVPDLSEALREAEALGSKTVWGPAELHSTTRSGHAGLGAVLLEPGGTAVGLLQLEKWTFEHFRLQPAR